MSASVATTPALYKRCSGCQLVLEANSFNFHKQKHGKYGFTSKCKTCKNLQIADWTKRNPEMSREQKLRWKNKNYEKYLQIKRDDQRRRKYRLKSGSITSEDWAAMLESCDYRCVFCGSGEDITQDHIIPLSKGGQNIIENIQPLCRSCNSKKRDKIL